MCDTVWFSAIIFTEVIANKPFSRYKPLNYLSSDLTQRHEYVLKERLSKSLGLESSVPSYKAANFRFVFTTFMKSALLLLAIITFGTAGGFNVGSKLSMAICAENTNIY